MTEDHREGVASFLEKREPNYVGRRGDRPMDFEIPKDLQEYLAELDEFIEREIKPLEEQDDNIRFFDHRREDARTDWDRGGLPNERVGAAPARGAPPRRRGRPLPLPVPEGVRGPGRHQPRHGDHPRAPRAQGPRPPLRPAERARDRRQQRRPAPDDQVRHRGAEGGVDRRPRRGTPRLRVRHHRAEPRLRRDVDGDDGRPRAATSGSSTARRRSTPASTARSTT